MAAYRAGLGSDDVAGDRLALIERALENAPLDGELLIARAVLQAQAGLQAPFDGLEQVLGKGS